MAYLTTSVTELQPSFLIMLDRCVSKVFVLTLSTSAASLLLLPSASNCTTSLSFVVSDWKSASFVAHSPSKGCATRSNAFFITLPPRTGTGFGLTTRTRDSRGGEVPSRVVF